MSEDIHVMSTSDRLIYMAHQIARNLATMEEENAIAALHEHLTSFWDPRMKAQIIAIAKEQPEKLSPIVAAAVARLTPHWATDHADPARSNTVGEAGHCDAG